MTCQDVSHAGKRAGIAPGTRSGLWSEIHRAIQVLRPSLVVAENVRGLLSADAHSDVEPCPWCVGDGGSGRPLRALGAVLGSLADIGYDAAWCGVRAADVGACHGRFRVFIVAWDAAHVDGEGVDAGAGRGWRAEGQARGSGGAAADAGSEVVGQRPGLRASWQGGQRRGRLDDGRLPGAAADAEGDGRHEGRPEPAGLVGGPDAAVGGAAADAEVDEQREPAIPRPLRPKLGNGATGVAWGQYAAAVRRWERLTRPAPAPTETSAKGSQRLSPAFVEWMMGLPAGHVTAVPGLTRNDQLKALGNGVVPQQAAAALTYLLSVASAEGVAA